MPPQLTPAVLGAIVRDARLAAGLSQTALATRIGASRFWIAEFEQGKPSAELGLALKAVQALGLTVRVAAGAADSGRARADATRGTSRSDLPVVDLEALLAAASGQTAVRPQATRKRHR